MARPVCSTRECHSLPENPGRMSERRLSLWRRSIALFDRTRQEEGVFHRVGYRDFILEPILDNDAKPDLLGTSESRFVTCELSVSPNKDFSWFDQYLQGGLTPYLKTLLGVVALESGAAPFFLTTESGFRDFPARMNALLLYPPYERRCPSVSDPALRAALDEWNGFAHPPPNYSLLAVPESDLQEVKLPLGGMFKQRASAGGSLSSREATRQLLGDMVDSFPPASRRVLDAKVRSLMEQAAAYLKDFARYDKKRRILRFAGVDSAAGRRKFSRAVSEWAGTRFIETWSDGEDRPVEEDDDV